MDSDRNSGQRKPGRGRLPQRALQRPGCRGWSTLIWIAMGVVVVLLVLQPWAGLMDRIQIPYTEFRQQLLDGNVPRVTVTGQEIRGTLGEPAEVETVDDGTQQYTDFVTYLPSFGDDELLSALEAQGVQVVVNPESQFNWLSILLSAFPLVLMAGFGYLLISQMRTQGRDVFSFGKSQARLYDRRDERTTFQDVAGAQGPKQELQEIITFLKDPSHIQRLGGQMPKGVLLVGPPGTGKTLLARAVAGEAEVPFFSITGSNFMEMFVGVGASRVRDLFDAAKKASPSIIFIDELDSIGRRRGAGVGGGHDEREQTLNQLLSELDGFEPNEGVIIMAATNRPDILDQALLRPGRFDRLITIDLPTMHARHEILNLHARNKPLGDDVDLESIAQGTPGFSGADLANLLNEGALLAARRGAEEIAREDLEEARDKVLMGLERENMALTDEECRMLAYHEGGHAVVAAVQPHADPIHKVTIVPRGQAMGVTQQLPERDKYIYPRQYLLDRLAVMMGGRAAEKLVMDIATTGAESDFTQATRLARKMVLDWGMSERLGFVSFGGDRQHVFLGEEIGQQRPYSEATAREIDEEVRAILDEAHARALDALLQHREALDRVADALLEREEIPGDEVLELVGVVRDDGKNRPKEEVSAVAGSGDYGATA